jgi:hypothetical protein
MNVPNNTTFNLQNVVDVVGSTSLSGAFACAQSGKFNATYSGTKTCLLNFRAYCGGDVNFCNISSTACGGTSACACLCINPTPALALGESYTLTVGGSLSTICQGASALACWHLKCNGTTICCKVIAGNICCPSITSTITVSCANTVHLIIQANTMSTTCLNNGSANATITSATNIKGGYSNGTTCLSCYMYTG